MTFFYAFMDGSMWLANLKYLIGKNNSNKIMENFVILDR
jgi:hypothetical protein